MYLRGSALRREGESLFDDQSNNLDNQTDVEQERIQAEQKMAEDFDLAVILLQESEAQLECRLSENESSAGSPKERAMRDYMIKFALGQKYLASTESFREQEKWDQFDKY